MAMVADGSSIKDSSVVYDISEATLQRHMKKGRYMVNNVYDAFVWNT